MSVNPFYFVKYLIYSKSIHLIVTLQLMLQIMLQEMKAAMGRNITSASFT